MRVHALVLVAVAAIALGCSDVVGIDALYITTRGTTDPPEHLYRIPLP